MQSSIRNIDNSDYPAGEDPLPSRDSPNVIVNDTIVVKGSNVLKDVYPGQPIRNAILNKRMRPLAGAVVSIVNFEAKGQKQ